MKTGIAVFAYNRGIHLQKTLEGLKKNDGVEELYIFHDGLKSEKDRIGWEASRKVIEDIDWCKVNYFPAEKNKGLARSIIDGINYVLAENNAVIVLEDDCVPTPNFLRFMRQCFEKYQDNKRVYSIGGFGWPINVTKNQYDIYFTGRISSWGWGTWKDRWEQYAIDNDILNRIKNDKEKSICLAAWGSDLEGQFIDRMNGKNDSWAVYWALKVIEEGGLCVAPYVSLIENIGFDGTGVNCGETDRFAVDLAIGKKEKYALPDEAVAAENIKKAWIGFFGNYTNYNTDESKPHVIIYGLGHFFIKNEKYICDNYYIEAFVDRVKEGYFAGRKVIRAGEIAGYPYEKIIIMLQDIEECRRVAEMLTYEYDIPQDRIRIGSEIL